MTFAPSVWPLPYGVSIRTDYSSDHNYALPRSQTQCWPVQLKNALQVTIVAMQNGWMNHQAWTMRGWLSIDPNGDNILPAVYGINRNVHLSFSGNSWNFYSLGSIPEKANVSYLIDPTQIYYFNIQNVSNEDESYYCRFTFVGKGTNIIL